MAAYEGRFGDAVRVLRAGAIDDVENMRTENAASKLVGAASAELGRGRSRAAIDAADDALAQSRSVKTRFLAARVFIEAGAAAKARPLITSLAASCRSNHRRTRRSSRATWRWRPAMLAKPCEP
jgi:hypothetical protein